LKQTSFAKASIKRAHGVETSARNALRELVFGHACIYRASGSTAWHQAASGGKANSGPAIHSNRHVDRRRYQKKQPFRYNPQTTFFAGGNGCDRLRSADNTSMPLRVNYFNELSTSDGQT
jgi:hypothetical protein